MNNKLFVSGYVHFPQSALNDAQREEFREKLTYQSPFTDDTGNRKTILMYKENEEYFSLPIEWTRKNLPAVYAMAEDRRVTPGKLEYSKLPNPNHPSVKDPEGQKQFMDDLLETVKTKENVFAVAKTGSGKTVCALRTAALLGYRTLVLVDRNELKKQWIREIQDKLGIPEDRIGIIQEDKCEWEDKDIVIGLLQTNARRELDDATYNAFGTVIVDECDVLTTEFFNDVLPRFNAKYRIGLTATPIRKDQSHVVLFNHIGEIRVTSEAKILPVKVHVYKYMSESRIWGNDDKQQMLSISRDKVFSEIVAQRVLEAYKAGRDILVVAEKIDHLEGLIEKCVALGLPKEDTGLFTAQCSKYDKTYEWKKIGRRPTTEKERTTALTKKVVFSTVKMVDRGIDIPRWDCLIEAAPLWRGAQLLGRIRRPCKGKRQPIAITWRHMKSMYAEQRYYSRVKEYGEVQAQIFHH